MSIEFDRGAHHHTEQQTVSNPLEHVVSSELVQAEYDGYRAYHKHTRRQDNPHENESMSNAWCRGYGKAYKDD